MGTPIGTHLGSTRPFSSADHWDLSQREPLIVVVQLVPEKASWYFPIDILAGTNVIKVQGSDHVAQQEQRRVAHLMGGNL